MVFVNTRGRRHYASDGDRPLAMPFSQCQQTVTAKPRAKGILLRRWAIKRVPSRTFIGLVRREVSYSLPDPSKSKTLNAFRTFGARNENLRSLPKGKADVGELYEFGLSFMGSARVP